MPYRDDNTEVHWGALRPILQDLSDRLARIEQFLVASGLQVPPSGAPPAPQPGFGEVHDATPSTFEPSPTDAPGRIAAAVNGIDVGATPTQGSGIPDFIVQLAVAGKTIQAIKEFRSFSGMSLKESKAIVEQIANRGY